jgi:hypothetical protein
MRELSGPTHKTVFRVSKPIDLLKAMKAAQRADSDTIGIRIGAGLKGRFVARLGDDAGMSQVIKALIGAYVLHSDRENTDYLRVLAEEVERRSSADSQARKGRKRA